MLRIIALSALLAVVICQLEKPVDYTGHQVSTVHPQCKDDLGILHRLRYYYGVFLPTTQTLLEKCYGDLGCFSNGPPFFDVTNRPISFLPDDNIDTKFLLYKNPDINSFKYIEPSSASIQSSGFDINLETKVIIHGYSVQFNEIPFLFNLKDELLKYKNYNVIFLNWTQNNKSPNYPQAVANARVVGAQLARLLQFLHDNGPILLEDVHVIGHSLGGHIAGWAGERLKNLGRISGVDPAGTYFHNAIDLVRLDVTDAIFVDVMHTNAGTNILNGYGMMEPIGHLDFYPNGGSMQPGCEKAASDDDSFLKGVKETATQIIGKILPERMSLNSCSHRRTVDLYAVTVRQEPESFQGVACDSWENYKKGECNTRYRRYRNKLSLTMGFHATKNENITKSSKFYLKTSATPPFVP